SASGVEGMNDPKGEASSTPASICVGHAACNVSDSARRKSCIAHRAYEGGPEMASQPKKRTRQGARKAKTRARGSKPKTKRRGPGSRATRARARSKPKRTHRSSKRNVGRARRSRRTQPSVDTQTFEERFTPEGELPN